jgi:hypothetical protein
MAPQVVETVDRQAALILHPAVDQAFDVSCQAAARAGIHAALGDAAVDPDRTRERPDEFFGC